MCFGPIEESSRIHQAITENVSNNKPVLMYLGASLGQVYQRLKLLKEQHMYVKLNKALISTHGVTECLKETFLRFTDSFVF